MEGSRENREYMRNLVCCIIVFVSGAAAGMLLPRFCPFLSPDAEVVVQTDTLTVRDTIRETRPVYVDRTRTDTMLVAVTDTVTVRDTVYLVLDREQRHYRGDGYDAWVSGYRPQLDSVWVYPETRYVTRDIISVSSRKCNSIALESSASWCCSMSLTISAEYEHSWRWCYVGAGVGYDVVTRSPYIAVRVGVPIWSW